MENDWDLSAVVRSFINGSSTPTPTSTAAATTFTPPPASIDGSGIADDPFPELASMPFDSEFLSDFPGFLDHRNDTFQGLQESHNDFYINPAPVQTTLQVGAGPAMAHPVFQGSFYDPLQVQPLNYHQPHQQQIFQPSYQFQAQEPSYTPLTTDVHIHPPASLDAFPSADGPHPSESRKRKPEQEKVVCRLTREELTADLWAWRKYGQKPIKGSPYPRNYYKCSTSKECPARKQVDRSPTEENIFVVTYAGDHNHPPPAHKSSLSGSTRKRLCASTTSVPTSTRDHTNTASSGTSLAATSSPAASASASFSPTTPLTEGDSADKSQNEVAKEDNSNIVLDMVEGKGQVDDDDEEEEEVDDDDESVLIPNTFPAENFFRGFHFHELNGRNGFGTSTGAAGAGFSGSSFLFPPWGPTNSTGPAAPANFAHGGGGF